MNSNLPFPRGQTASWGDNKIAGPNGLVSTLPTTTGLYNEATAYRRDLAGYIAETTDDKIGNTTVAAALGTTSGKACTAGRGGPLKLRAVQMDADLTVDCIGQMIAMSLDAGEIGVVGKETTASGCIAKPLDGAYPVGTSFKKYDWVWVIEEGRAVVTPAHGEVLAAGGPVSVNGTAGQVGPSAAGNAVLGTCEVTKTGSISGTTSAVLAEIIVTAGLATSDAATAS